VSRGFWIIWIERAQREIGALLADTIGVTPSKSDVVFECVNKLIDVEQQLSSAIEPERPFRWTRHSAGNWTSNGYEIKRDRPSEKWRILRNGEHWDSVAKLNDAKLLCEFDFSRRQRFAGR
jgi:hypothetical protein